MTGTYTAFEGTRCIGTGDLHDVVTATHAAANRQPADPVLVFQDRTGRVVDLDLRGTPQDAIARLADHPMVQPDPPPEPALEARGPGRPRLGVVSREISLLPRHWEWLQGQPRSASATMRMLIEARIKAGAGREAPKRRAERAYRVMSALAGNLPDFEEASRALFAFDADALAQQTAAWPEGVRDYVLRLATQE